MSERIALDGVLFDLGNTLIRFTPKESMEFVMKWYRSSIGENDGIPFEFFLESYRRIVKKERHRAEKERWESSVEFRTGLMMEDLGKTHPITDGIHDRLLSTHTDSFLSCLRMRSSAKYVLDILKDHINDNGDRIRMGIISNAMDHAAIRHFIDSNDLSQYFDTIIISGEVGLTKPRREIFDQALRELSVKPSRSVYMGDRYLTDVIGSLQAGMIPIYTREFHTAGEPPENMDPQTRRIDNILDLLPMLSNISQRDIQG